VERERARMRFRAATWWGVEGTFASPVQPAEDDTTTPRSFGAALVSLDGTAIATGRDFNADGDVESAGGVRVLDGPVAAALATGLEGETFTVRSVTERPFRRSPAAPFMTSTLQQEAGRKLRFSAARAMQVAQRLYEQGWITYMRTDSTTLSDQALSAARSQATALYGSAYVPAVPRRYERKVKNAQEAHEAIRPAGEVFRTPDQAADVLHGDELRLYELIWKRTVASQMIDATGVSAQVRLVATVPEGTPQVAGAEAEFSANGRVITFPGFLRAYVEGEDDPEAELAEREVMLPPLTEGQSVAAMSFEPGDHTTQPPPRYTEASLVKSMEELGVGRPSTYASVISTIVDRGYVWKKGSALVPSFTAFAVTGLMERHFGELVDYGFTATMENDLDEIADGHEEALPWLTRFYFGASGPRTNGSTKRTNGSSGSSSATSGSNRSATPPNGSNGSDSPALASAPVELGGDTLRLGLKAAVAVHLGEIDAREINSIPIGADSNGELMVVRVGRYGPYLQRGEDRASLAEDLAPDELTPLRAEELLDAPSEDRVLGQDPETGLDVWVKAGRFGPYVQLGAVVDGQPKPKTASLFASMTPATLTFEEALRLLSIPRSVGTDTDSGEEIFAHNGRFGPYLKRGADTRSLTAEEQILSIGLDEAKAIFLQPKPRRGRAAAGPLRELGPDPETQLPVVLRDGRFGPYVTDGTANASLRRGDNVESITIERAAELLAERRAAGPSKRAKKAAAKKRAPAKKAAPKKRAAPKAAAPTEEPVEELGDP
ncbi:MAG: type I DNA topoisomerase, partial [Acidimicrobiales bacterium]